MCSKENQPVLCQTDFTWVTICFIDHGVGSPDHIQKSVIFIVIHYLFHLHFHLYIFYLEK